MSKAISNLPIISVNPNISDLKASSVSTSVSTDSTNTGNLSRRFLDDKNANLYIKTRVAVLRSKKSSLDQEIFRFNQIYQENRLVGALELFNQMTLQHLTNLMREFLDINQQISHLQSQLNNDVAEIQSNLVN